MSGSRPTAPASPPADQGAAGPPVTDPGRPALRAAGLRHAHGDLQVLDGVDLEVATGTTVALVGPSGCGKSTLLDLVTEAEGGGHDGAADGASGGTIEAVPAAMMPQADLLLPWMDARDNVALPARIAGVRRRAARAAAQDLLDAVGLGAFARTAPHRLSGGMRQRVSFLRALATERPLLCLDEPFGALDAITRADLHAWLADRLDEHPRTVLLVTHDVEEAVLLADRVVVLGPRPARVVAEVVPGAGAGAGGGTLPPPRRRRPDDPAVVAARRAVLDALGARA